VGANVVCVGAGWHGCHVPENVTSYATGSPPPLFASTNTDHVWLAVGDQVKV
jgi:hypothetical protein